MKVSEHFQSPGLYTKSRDVLNLLWLCLSRNKNYILGGNIIPIQVYDLGGFPQVLRKWDLKEGGYYDYDCLISNLYLTGSQKFLEAFTEGCPACKEELKVHNVTISVVFRIHPFFCAVHTVYKKVQKKSEKQNRQKWENIFRGSIFLLTAKFCKGSTDH